ncbi:MAG: alpha/beta fold hydrolase [Desulfobacterium sp.]
MKLKRTGSISMLAVICLLASTLATADTRTTPLVIQEQGSFFTSGSVIKTPGTFDPKKLTVPDGQTLHGDHAYVFYQIPENARKMPLVLWHGYGQSSKTWETTPDGREGFQNIFLRRRFPVYTIDQPRRGNAGQSTEPVSLDPVTQDQRWFNIFRVGVWPNFFPGVQFPQDAESVEQYFRQMTPDTGPIDLNKNVEAVSAIFDKTGPGVLVTHSHSGGMGWLTVLKNQSIKAVVSFEPGSGFVFPKNEIPAPMPSSGGTLTAVGIPMAAFGNCRPHVQIFRRQRVELKNTAACLIPAC